MELDKLSLVQEKHGLRLILNREDISRGTGEMSLEFSGGDWVLEYKRRIPVELVPASGNKKEKENVNS